MNQTCFPQFRRFQPGRWLFIYLGDYVWARPGWCAFVCAGQHVGAYPGSSTQADLLIRQNLGGCHVESDRQPFCSRWRTALCVSISIQFMHRWHVYVRVRAHRKGDWRLRHHHNIYGQNVSAYVGSYHLYCVFTRLIKGVNDGKITYQGREKGKVYLSLLLRSLASQKLNGLIDFRENWTSKNHCKKKTKTVQNYPQYYF